MSMVVFYGLLSVVLKLLFSIDILIPCIWKTTYDIECPGCGLTTAVIHLLRLDIRAAFDANPLVFLVVPSLIIYLFIDFRKFIRINKLSEIDKKDA